MNKLTRQFLSGVPVELTEASREVCELRDILEGDGVIIDDDGNDIDTGSDVYWNYNRTVAVYVPKDSPIVWREGYCIVCDVCAHNGMILLSADYEGPFGVDTYRHRYYFFSKAEAIEDFVNDLRELGAPVCDDFPYFDDLGGGGML